MNAFDMPAILVPLFLCEGIGEVIHTSLEVGLAPVPINSVRMSR